MKFAFFFLFVLQLAACSEQAPPALDKIHGYTMGTSYTIQWPKQSGVEPKAIQTSVDEVLKVVNQQMSTYQKDSELSLFNSASAPYEQIISADLHQVLEHSLTLNEFTHGYFDISVGPIVNLWGFGPDKMPNKKPSDEQIKATQGAIGLDAIKLGENSILKTQQRYLDLSAIAKGFGVDKVAQVLEYNQIQSYLVEIGGEMRVKGSKAVDMPWRVAVEKPDENQRSVQKVIEIHDAAMATSGDYRNYFEMDGQTFSHTIDPFTGLPVKHTLASVTIIDDTCARADALATAMLAMGAEKAKQFANEHEIKAYLIERTASGFNEFSTPAFVRWQTK